MIDINPNQLLFNPSAPGMQPSLSLGDGMFINQPGGMPSMPLQRNAKPSALSRIPSLHLPAIILLAISWLLHTIATFIPYWSVYSGIDGSRAGLWSARNFNYFTIQNFYFPQPTDFPTITDSIRFTNANTKAYLVTVQFLMTFNFTLMLIVLVLLTVDYVFAQQTRDRPWSLLIRDYNTSDTAIKYALLLYILYVFVIFEFAAWITYVGSRHDDNWNMHVSFAFAIIVSVFLVAVFIMYLIEFLKRFEKSRLKWDYWYGPYIEWGFFVYLSALLLLLIVICCPEWAYAKSDPLFIFAEIGLFKQCYSSGIYKKAATTDYCTLSNTRDNQAWVNATQAFMLIAYIIGMIILIIIVIYRKEFRHNARGYYAQRVSQPTFTYIIAGLILFFCFIFSLVGIAVFGGKVFPQSFTVNWAYILAIIAMVLFLITGILFILDAVHSRKQTTQSGSARNKSFFFPAPLNNRVLAMQPLLKPEPAWSPPAPPMGLPQPWPAPFPPWQPMGPPANFANPPFFPPQQGMIMPPPNYGMDSYPNAPLTQVGLANYFQQMLNNPQLPSPPYNEGLMNYSPDNSLALPDNRNDAKNDAYFTNMSRRHFLQQQRLNYNHERLLEKYSRLRTPRVSQFRTFGTSSLPGRNYNDYLDGMRGNDRQERSLVEQSRAGIASSDETYRWMGDESFEPLPRDVSSVVQHRRNEAMPFVYAEKFEPVKMYEHPLFGPTPAYIRPVFEKKTNHRKKKNADSENETISDQSDHEEKTKTANDDKTEVSDRPTLGYVSYKTWKTKHEHLVPVDPLLFNIYTQRSNGSIQSYGQSLYVPYGPQHRNRQSKHYKDLSTVSPAEIDSILADTPISTSSSSKHQYNKLHSQPTSFNMSRPPLESVSAGNSNDSSDSESDRIALSTPRLSQANLNPSVMPSSSLSAPLTLSIPPVTAKVTSPASTLLMPYASAVNNLGLLPPPSSPNTHAIPNISAISPTSRPVSVSSSTGPYQTLSSIVDNLPPTALLSKSTTARQSKNVPIDDDDDDDVISSNSDSDDDDDNNEKKQRGRQEKK